VKNRVNLVVGLGIALATLIGASLALMRYAEHSAETDMTQVGNAGPLAVRTDLMRGMPCHVADGKIMGDCAEEEVARFQREAQ
jgi:hypothetical protein